MLKDKDIFAKNDPDIAYRAFDGEAVVVNLKNSTFHVLNSVAAFIWDKLDGKVMLQDIAEMTSKEFAVDFSLARNDCEVCLKDLLDKQVICIIAKNN